MAETISADYLVVGAGAMGMAFVDTLLADTNATVAMVDRYHCPGGHWTTAYPFVRLHQPSAYYGVNSKHLGQDAIDKVGWNSGMLELATCHEVCAYFSQVMYQHFLPSGRVTYFPKCDYTGDGKFHSIVTARTFQVGKGTRIVDATFMRVTVPSMVPPAYDIARDVDLVTPNDLTKISRQYANYTVVGAGKTGIDTCLWLLAIGIDPPQIVWIMPRDSWLLDRSAYQPGPLFADTRHSNIQAQREAIMAATSVSDLFKRLDASGQLLRLSDKVWPTMYRCATVSAAELEQIRKIETVVRMGRVVRIGKDEVVLERGSHRPNPDTLYIDCSADGLAKLGPVPVFKGNQITLQSVRTCQQVFSAAFISHVEATYDDEKVKNELCRPIPHPHESTDWLIDAILNFRNRLRWEAEPKTAAWLGQARLNWDPLPPLSEEGRAELQTRAKMIETLAEKLQKLLGDMPEKEAEKAKAQIARP
ncbi:hypothetical protein HIM_08783 [Hirsutella minnesotensis 3608]|uniref:FAD/NAD(P)-binding domain-containing protein n=1 Tax=Hirsutella minnesotensis 3608 TaxID=1043627 RepID=A0A0F7ZY41_9HYPO|nr:hypothetical protein HIM_08783 [Hirsutella minnesotensis 3608]